MKKWGKSLSQCSHKCFRSSHWNYCRKGDPFQGPRGGSCLTLGNELSKETHILTKQETLLGRGAWVENRRVRELRRIALPWGPVLGFMIMFPIVSGRHFDSRSFLVAHASLSQDGFHRGGFWEVNRTFGLKSPLSFWPFPNSSDWR